MKKQIGFILCLALIFSACKKSALTIPSSEKDFASFLKNTEWVGTLDGNGYEYPPPSCIKFNADNTVIAYAPFAEITVNSVTWRDSIAGTIKSIDSLPDGRTKVKVSFDQYKDIDKYKDMNIYISNRDKLIANNTDETLTVFQLSLFPKKGFSLAGTHWRGPLIPGNANTYYYPDLSSIHFQQDGVHSVSVYSYDGQPVMLTQLDPLTILYKQIGARVYMSGYKFLPGGAVSEVKGYYGVLLPSGDKMMVHSNSPDARLPNYVDTWERYGPNGTTPIIYKY
ncbi:MAG: hypothetical protein ABI091_25185 [Ferruginibacter sp.]